MTNYPPVSPYKTGLAGKCPRCGEGNLFKGYLKIADQCGVCDLDYSKADSGDGPAVFVIFIAGFLAVSVLFVLMFMFDAAPEVAFLGSIFTTIVTCLVCLPIFKSTLIALQYANKAREARLDHQGE